LLACSIYVDLNPVRAGIAETPETSEFTAAYERIAARDAQSPQTEVADTAGFPPTVSQDAWLSPVPDADVPRLDAARAPSLPGPRASDRGFLPLTLDEYLELLDWTGRQVRADKRGAIPDHLLPILERLQVNADAWVDTIQTLGRSFRRAIGRASSLAALAAQRGKHWFQGVTAGKEAFG
jgi:hypothetical protein